ncbi:class I SAM-dependent methyltransferase [Caldithrix abyssi]|nr:class I SAM-dependent methyltransferase [Caldithrix abyssi]
MVSTPYDHIVGQYSAERTHLQPKELEYLGIVLDPLATGSIILDLGCGTGHPMATHIVSRGYRVVGVDGSDAMLEVARKRHPEQRWVHDFIERVEFDETFDAVVCWDSLFHLPRDQFQPVIRKIHRWLKPGGRTMVSTGGVVQEDGNGFTDTMFGYEFFYDSLPPHQMVALIERAGFDILVAEMCDQSDGARNKGKWATVASRKA